MSGPRNWPDMPISYTCGCGLYVHPDSPHRNLAAIHIPDCPYIPGVTTMTTPTNSDDTIDSRDVIARISELEDERSYLESELLERIELLDQSDGVAASARDSLSEALTAWDIEHGDELKALQALEAEAEGYSDWRHGAVLIRDSYFETYARQQADDLYDIRDASWPFCCIDWEKAADELKQDYTSVTFDGVDYWVRG
jgi:hypothetical protein